MEIRTYPNGPLQANLYVISFESDAIIIDPCVPYHSLMLDGRKVRGIICTHSHYDHIVEAENIRTQTGAEIMTFEEEKPLLLNASKSKSSSFFPAISVSDPVRALTDNEILMQSDFSIETEDDFVMKIIHTPGHTRGSMCILLTQKLPKGDKNYLFSGDTVFAGTVGRTDLGGSMRDMQRSIRKLSDLPEDTIVLPGHGQETTIGTEKRSNPYFTARNYDDII